ncbi:molybdopterin converting factor subunit 1 [Thauera aromatica]|uniref:molybdopterin converting factor subunit 1 n=1 Tax=Thauera aromatica TaxID=59405 RepID=UPI001FFCD71D|nr:molybdopterin converting factor subunit 1 [Thauera aromatica]MCK2089106.1 molybdopterin converting factor subunit 1 [Thauera aromatica]
MTTNVKILYFASLREAVGQSGEEFALPEGVGSVGALRAHLAARGEAWQALAAGRNVRAAVNQRIVGADAPLAAGDEVAFFPPVTGG